MKNRMWALALIVLVFSLLLAACTQQPEATPEPADTAADTGAPDTGAADTGADTTTGGETTGDTAVESADAAQSVAPVAVPDAFTTTMDTAVANNVLANDLDSSGNAVNPAQVTASVVTDVTNGTLQLNADGSFTYQPGAGYVGLDTFRYRVCDNTDAAACSEADVVFTVQEAAAGEVTGGDATADETTTEEGAAADTTTTGDAAAEAGGGAPDAETGTAGDLTGAGGATAPTAIQAGTVHVVKDLEWLIQIARCYGTTEQALLAANRIPNRNLIYPGQQIVISSPGSAGAVTGEPCVQYYTVQAGDTTASIAATYAIKESELKRINGIPYPNGFFNGQRLVIPRPVPPIMAP